MLDRVAEGERDLVRKTWSCEMWLPSDHQVSNAARTPEEVAFLRAVEFSDVTTVRRLLGDNPHLNVDAIDALGRTALRLAVRNENREVIAVIGLSDAETQANKNKQFTPIIGIQ